MQRLVQEMQETVKSTVVLAQNVESKDAAHVKVICTQIKQRQAEIALLQQKIRQAAQENDEALDAILVPALRTHSLRKMMCRILRQKKLLIAQIA